MSLKSTMCFFYLLLFFTLFTVHACQLSSSPSRDPVPLIRNIRIIFLIQTKKHATPECMLKNIYQWKIPHTWRISVAAGGRSKIYICVWLWGSTMPGIYSLSVICGPVKIPRPQCTEEYFRIIRMTTRREGEKSYRSDVYRIFKYNQHGQGDNQERRREKL